MGPQARQPLLSKGNGITAIVGSHVPKHILAGLSPLGLGMCFFGRWQSKRLCGGSDWARDSVQSV